MDCFEINAIRGINASFRVPGDKSISHRTAIFGGLARGVSLVRNFLPSEDCLHTLRAMTSLGAQVEVLEEFPDAGPVTLRIRGCAMRLSAPRSPIDCGNSGTGMRLLAGLLAGQPFPSELFGDASLSSRPMDRIIRPLAMMGASIETKGSKPGCAPLAIHAASLNPITYALPVASAQVKSAILLAGMFCDGETTVVQPSETRDHTERMLTAFGVQTVRLGNSISIRGGQVPAACDISIPGDISSAAFWIVAAASAAGSKLTIRDVGLNPTRTAVLAVLSRMGAGIREEPGVSHGEPFGEIRVTGADLHGTAVLESEIPNLIDELPVIAVAGALAKGKTSIRNARELRVKESDRIAVVVKNLRAMGAEVREFEDGMEIEGGRPLHGAVLESHGDHRIAMAFAIAGLFAQGGTTIRDTACVNTSYPGFAHHLAAVMAGRTDPSAFDLPVVSHQGS